MMIFCTRGNNNCFVQGQQLLLFVHRFRKSFIKKIPLSTTTTTTTTTATRRCSSNTISFRNNNINNEKQAMIQNHQRRRWNTNKTVGSGTSSRTSTSTIAMPTPKQLRIVAFRAAIPVSCVSYQRHHYF
jgi:hypothetical protein